MRIAALVLLIAGCGINEPDAYYLRVRVDNHTWNATSLPTVLAGETVYILGTRADSATGEQLEFTLTLTPGSRPGVFTLRTPAVFGPPDRSAATYAEYTTEGPTFWETNDALPGSVRLTVVDPAAGVIAGSFAATIRAAVLGDGGPPDRRVSGSFRLPLERP
jgi:hypothetical protein